MKKINVYNVMRQITEKKMMDHANVKMDILNKILTKIFPYAYNATNFVRHVSGNIFLKFK